MKPFLEPVEEMIEALLHEEPSAHITINQPQDKENGLYYIDFRIDGEFDSLQYRKSMGYGVFTEEAHAFQTRPDEIYKDATMAAKRAVSLLKRKNKTMMLQDLRGLLNKTQVEMAALLNVNQAAISKFENRNDVKLSTFNDYVAALGGRLEVNVVFPDFSARVNVGKPS